MNDHQMIMKDLLLSLCSQAIKKSLCFRAWFVISSILIVEQKIGGIHICLCYFNSVQAQKIAYIRYNK
jgi:hypothetical protein